MITLIIPNLEPDIIYENEETPKDEYSEYTHNLYIPNIIHDFKKVFELYKKMANNAMEATRNYSNV